ncbi:MAG: 5-aminolevulinate synthase [Chitinophagaceae bacterium]
MFDYNACFAGRIRQLKETGSYRYFLEVNKSAQHFPHFYYSNEEGVQRSAINWCSNDYLCMSTEEEVIAKLGFVTHRSGSGSGGTRNISGTTIHHRELEHTLAQWHEKESALLFAGAYLANVTALQTLGRHIPGLVFVSDERNHASMIEGMRSVDNRRMVFRHNDVAHLEELLQSLPAGTPSLIAFESIYSITGSVAPAAEIIALAKKYNALTYVDEVHAVGLYGSDGAGWLQQQDLQKEVDIINGTLSKAIGVFGGYIAASQPIVDFIRSFGSGFIFTTSLPPAVCSAANKSIAFIRQHPERRTAFHENVLRLREALQLNGIAFNDNRSHITSIPVQGATRCWEVARQLLQAQGVYLQPINHPTVPQGQECLRIIVTSRHQPKHINHLAHSLKKVLHACPAVSETFA